MSAFIVDKRHIDLMVVAALEGTRDGKVKPSFLHAPADAIGQMLVTENVKSVQARYPGERDGGLPGPGDEYYYEPYKFEHTKYVPTAEELRGAIDCYTYQSSEHREWQESIAYGLCQVMLGQCPPKTDHYRQSEVTGIPWEFRAEHIAVLAARNDAIAHPLAVRAARGDESARAALSDWCIEKGYMTEPFHPRDQILAPEPEAMAKVRREEERKSHIENNPHLLKQEDKPDWPSTRRAAENLRRELKLAFPGTKFSVKTEYASMMSAIRVGWTCGPTTKQVEAIANKYRYGDWNGMEDIYEYSKERTWSDVFGSTKYVTCERDYQPEGLLAIYQTLAEAYRVPCNGANTVLFSNGGNYYASDLAHRILAKSELNGTLHGVKHVEGVTCGSHEDFWQAY